MRPTLVEEPTLGTLARRRAQATPDATAFVEPDGTGISFARIVAEAVEVAAGPASLGLESGDTFSFQLPNWREAVAINLAAALLGLRINPITPIYRGAELRMILADSGSRLIFAPTLYRSNDYAAMLRELRGELPSLEHVVTVRGEAAEGLGYEALRASGRDKPIQNWPSVAPASPKMLLYTSGTTGRAKGAVHSHLSMMAYARSSADYWRLDASDMMLMPSPVTHVTGYTFGMELPFICGTKAVLMERWDAAQAVDLIDRLGVTCSVGATPFLKELIDEAQRLASRLPSLRLFACGGAAASAALIRRVPVATERCHAFRIYGATEAPMVTKGVIDPARPDVAGETDGLVIDYEVKVVDTEGRTISDGSPGELLVKGPSLFTGYTDPRETAHALDEEGYFRTGDIGIYRDGAVTITGRLKDIIIRGGENISPAEIEAALERHPAISEAAVVAMPHPRLGEGVCAFLRPAVGKAEQPALSAIVSFLDAAGLARQKFPERVLYLDDFPRTPSGKIRKDLLRARAREV